MPDEFREHLTRDQRPFLHPESLQIFRYTASSLQFISLIFYRVQVREHLTRDQRPFLHPESLQIFRYTASSLQFTSLIFYRVQIREHLTRDQRPFLHPESLQIFRFTASSLQFTSLIFYRVQVREHLTRDQRPFLHPESLQIFRYTASPLQFTSLIFYRVQVREHLTRDQRPFLHPESLQIFRFTASSLQFTHSSSTGLRSENTWHEIRDHSFIQNHSRSSDSQLLLFSSLTHLLQGSGQRTPDTRSETIPSSRITPDLQITASSLSSPHSSSTGFRSENTWHEIRDHSFIQNHSRSSDTQLLLFSSLTHLLQGSGQRTPDTRSETIPSSRITPDFRFTALLFSSPHSSSTGFRSENTWHEIRDHSFIQNHSDLHIHSFFSSVHSLIFYRVQVREHLTWDQRPFLHPNHSRSSDSQLLLFSSLIFYRGSGQRTPDTRSETIPSSRITPDLQIHSFLFSSLTHLLQGSGQRTPDTRSETIPSSRITPDLQIHSFSLQFTHLLQGSGQRTPDTRSETIPSSRITPDLQIHSFFLFSSLIFYRVQVREHLTRDQRPFLHPESLQIFRFTASSLQFTHSFYRVQVREHLTRDQRPFLHPESLQIFRFTASSLQFTHSSSTGFRSENTWHEIRDHSFIQNHSRSSDSQLLLFSSLTHLLQGSGQRTPDTRSETIPSSRITPDLQTQLLLFSSLIFYRVQVREHLTRDQRPFLHPESLQIFRFTASSLQFTHSSSTGFRSENTWHEIRDHSFIQNHSRSSDSQLLLFSSLTHLLQGSVREHLTRDQRPFLHPESLQIFRFTASSLQFTHSSSTGFRSENTWHEIRDHSFIQNHSRSSDSQLLLFSSLTHLLQGSVREHLTRDQRPFLHPESLQIFRFTASLFSSLTHLLQGSGQRTPDTRSETIPSSRITPDLQIHSFFSSVHSLIFYRVQVREHLTRDQRPFLHPESLQIFRFTASSLQFTHSSSTGFRSENTWHEIRDHSFIQNHSRSSDSQLLLFSSPHSSSTGFRSENTWHEIRDHSFIQNHSRSSDSQLLSSVHLTHLLQGSGQRTPDTRSETIPSSRITPDLQIHSFFSSVHLTHLLQGSGQRTPDTRSETIPSSRITPDLQIHSFFSSVHSLIFYRVQSENTWHEIRDHSFIQNHSRSSDSQLLSSVHSLIFYRVQVREHLTRDQRPFLHPESLQIFRFTASLFSSLTHLLQGSGQRTPDTRSETIPSSRITPDLQIHSFFSSVHSLIFYRVQVREHLTRDQRPFLHPESLQIFRFTASSLQFTSLIFYRVQVREHLTRDQRPFLHPESLQIFRFTASLFSSLTHLLQGSGQRTGMAKQKLGFVLSDPFCVFWGLCLDFVRLEDPNMAHYKISNRVRLMIFYLLVFDKSWCHVSKQDAGPPAEI